MGALKKSAICRKNCPTTDPNRLLILLPGRARAIGLRGCSRRPAAMLIVLEAGRLVELAEDRCQLAPLSTTVLAEQVPSVALGLLCEACRLLLVPSPGVLSLFLLDEGGRPRVAARLAETLDGGDVDRTFAGIAADTCELLLGAAEGESLRRLAESAQGDGPTIVASLLAALEDLRLTILASNSEARLLEPPLPPEVGLVAPPLPPEVRLVAPPLPPEVGLVAPPLPPEVGLAAPLLPVEESESVATDRLNSSSRSELLTQVSLETSFTEPLTECSCDVSDEPETDLDVLVDLYSRLGGVGWARQRGWLSDEPLGRWQGVGTNSAGRVTSLDLHDNLLEGELPSSIGRLTSLERLCLHNNEISGSLDCLCSLERLEYLWLYQNRFRGPIPEDIGRLRRLRYLDLDMNELSGPIPNSFSELRDLEILSLRENKGLAVSKSQLRKMLSNLEDITL